MWVWVWEKITGRPYWSGRSAVAEFGPPLGAQFADVVGAMSDFELLALDPHRARRVLAARRRMAGTRVEVGAGLLLDETAA